MNRTVLAAVAAATMLVPRPLVGQSVHQVARADGGAVATAHPLATFAAQRILEAGGNAADAAVASAFAVAVVLPSMNSIGGRNQILVRSADGSTHAIDGTTQVPASYDPETAPRGQSGYATIGIPGVVAGLTKLHRDHGSMPLDELMTYAIEYAEHGFRLMPQEEFFHAMATEDLAATEGAAQYFLRPDGTGHRAGDLLVQTDLAQTLRQIAADGGESFYRGAIARRIGEDMADNGGFVSEADMAGYEALDGRVVRGSYRGFELVGAGIPAAGAVTIQALQILETFERDDHEPEAWAAMAGQAIGIASGELGALGTDSAATRATSKEWARAQAGGVVTGGDDRPIPTPILRAAGPSRVERSPWQAPEPHFTTHVSVADADGMAVALTQTVGPVMGSRVATPGLGFHYAVTLGGYLSSAGPGARARSFISPLFVLRDGEPVMVLGAAGGARIVSSIVQVVSRVVDDGMSLPEAMAAPRVFMGFGGTLEMETSGAAPWTEPQLEAVRALGLDVTPVDGPVAFALVQALRYHTEEGAWEAVSEPDGEGAAAGAGGRRPDSP